MIGRRWPRARFAWALAWGGLGCAKGLPVPEPSPTIAIPAGTYALGANVSPGTECPSSVCPGEYLPHTVTLTRPFQIEATEVSVLQYMAFEAFNEGCGGGGDNLNIDQGDEPAQVAIEHARSYCRWRGRRLPTAAEWEVAARLKAPDGTALQRFPWGDAPKSCAEVPANACGEQKRNKVGTNPIDRTPLGILDMGGSLPEWVEDDYTVAAVCEWQTPISAACNQDQSCADRVCSQAPQGCAGSCTNPSSGQNCAQSAGNNRFCFLATRPFVDPLHVTFDHSQGFCGPNYSGGYHGGHGPNPMVKGGGVTADACTQDPAAFMVANNNAGGPGPRYGFRCVEGDAPTPRSVVRLQFSGPQPCTKIGVTIAPGSQAPAGWGVDIRVVLLSSRGAIAGTFNPTGQRYDLDPAALCQQQQFGGGPNPTLMFSDVPPANFDVQVSYRDDQRACNSVTQARVETTGGENSCNGGSHLNLNQVSCAPGPL